MMKMKTDMRCMGIGMFFGLLVLLTGCASTIQSNVTAFHEWPAQMTGKSYVFERSKVQDGNLEYRNYENLVRTELQRLGFTEAGIHAAPDLKVNFDYQTAERDVRITQPVMVSPGWGPPYYGPGWPNRHFPFYDPFWYGPPVVAYSDTSYRLYSRTLHVAIARMADTKKLFDVTVKNDSKNALAASVMPYMIKSAFSDFPGPSGMVRQIRLKTQE